MSSFGTSSSSTQEGTDGRPHTGSGGGGGAVADGKLGGNGASGIVIIRYRVDSGIVASGGSSKKGITDGGINYQVHYFAYSDDFNVISLGTGEIEYLIVGGGGGGSYNNFYGSGGGGGGVHEGSLTLTSATSYSITVGAGGNRATSTNSAGQIGGSSSAFGFTAGGGGSSLNYSASGSPQNNPAFSENSPATNSSGSYGAGGAGGPGLIDQGGPGYLSSIDGIARRYAAGGGSGRSAIPGGEVGPFEGFEPIQVIFNNTEEYRIEVITEVIVPLQRSSLVFHQRIYSDSQGWCYYSTLEETNAEPLPTETVPQHNNDLGEHQLISITSIIEQDP